MDLRAKILAEIEGLDAQIEELRYQIKQSIKTHKPYQDDVRQITHLNERRKTLAANLDTLKP